MATKSPTDALHPACHIRKIVLSNFRQFALIEVNLDEGLNIFVGDNDSGKSTIVQAIEMALSGTLGGRSIDSALSPHLFPIHLTRQFLEGLKAGTGTDLPRMFVELYFSPHPNVIEMKGKNNSLGLDVPGIRLDVAFDSGYDEEYKSYIADPTQVTSLPIEYYRVDRRDFSGESVLGRRARVRSTIIDASTLRLQSGTDFYLRRSIDQHISTDVRAKLSLALRSHREKLMTDPAFELANSSLNAERTTLKKSSLALATDSSVRNSWESSIIPHLDSVPFDQVGKGEQSAFKILMALEKSASDSHVVVVEEPENHLSHANLNTLVQRVRDRSVGQQLVLTTHSSFVLNKLGIDRLKLLSGGRVTHLKDLPLDTQSYFLRLAGFDTLRIVLARAVILVEGPSDELVVQRIYRQKYGHEPLADGIDVISVQALAFKRFLELGRALGRRIAVVTDADDDSSLDKATKRFADFEVDGLVKGFVGKPSEGRTLEPQLVHYAGRVALNEVFGTECATDEEMVEVMTDSKTDCALQLYECPSELTWPSYLENAIEFVK